MEGIFPCVATAAALAYPPSCGILTLEEDGFLRGRPFIQSADSGHTVQVFSSTEAIKTYGIAVQGCAEFSPDCFFSYTSITIFCLLPRQQCG